MGKAILTISEAMKLLEGLSLYWDMMMIEAMKWVIEEPTQQPQLQKGEQLSGWWSPLWFVALVNSVFILPSLIAFDASEQGIILCVKTSKANMKTKNFMVANLKLYV